VLTSPNIRVARELGLPSGDWSDAVGAPSGAEAGLAAEAAGLAGIASP
jgi:hypothetical protein